MKSIAKRAMEKVTDENRQRVSDQAKAVDLLGVSRWVAVENGLPDELETVWISNGKGWTTLGCIAYAEEGWLWAETNGIIYEKEGKIVSECEFEDLDVKFWRRLPDPPCY